MGPHAQCLGRKRENFFFFFFFSAIVGAKPRPLKISKEEFTKGGPLVSRCHCSSWVSTFYISLSLLPVLQTARGNAQRQEHPPAAGQGKQACSLARSHHNQIRRAVTRPVKRSSVCFSFYFFAFFFKFSLFFSLGRVRPFLKKKKVIPYQRPGF